MGSYTAPDGMTLAYREIGAGEPLVCLPGGPMQDAGYLGDLGGVKARLVLLDPRGTGASATPSDPSSYRCDRQVEDVDALRVHLGLDAVDLLGHSAGANLAILYAARHPHRVRRLVLVGPSVRAVGVDVPGEERQAVAVRRNGEPWYPGASEALARLMSGNAGDGDEDAVAPFFHGRWDDSAADFDRDGRAARNDEAAAICSSEEAFDPDATRAALAALTAPTLIVAGELDMNTPPSAAEQVAALFARAEFIIQPSAGHYPWRDDPTAFARSIDTFLTRHASVD